MSTTDDYRGSARELLDWLVAQLDRIDERQRELDEETPSNPDDVERLMRYRQALENDRVALQHQLQQALADRGLLAA